MADNLQYIPQTGGSYVDWSRNVTPMIQSWIDMSKAGRDSGGMLNVPAGRVKDIDHSVAAFCPVIYTLIEIF